MIEIILSKQVLGIDKDYEIVHKKDFKNVTIMLSVEPRDPRGTGYNNVYQTISQFVVEKNIFPIYLYCKAPYSSIYDDELIELKSKQPDILNQKENYLKIKINSQQELTHFLKQTHNFSIYGDVLISSSEKIEIGSKLEGYGMEFSFFNLSLVEELCYHIWIFPDVMAWELITNDEQLGLEAIEKAGYFINDVKFIIEHEN